MTPLCTNSRGASLSRARTRPGRVRGGFALLLTVTLLAFAVLLLLSLATLTHIETAVAANAQQAAAARQNACMALQLAIGRLQRFAGPDQRVTARANLLPGSAGNPYWTGVWDATVPSSVPLTWLVCGNDTEPLALTPAMAPVADPAPDNDSVWLLRTPVSAAAQRIKLTRQSIRAADLPGLAGPQTVGHFAWWVGDEGVKAKFNLVNPYAAAAPGTADNLLQSMSAQQSGIEKLTAGLAAYVAAKDATAAGAALRDRLGCVLTPNQIPYADSSFSLATLRDRFHDLTTYSMGVLGNARDGGLRKDLTRGLEADSIVPAGEVFPGGPVWALVRSFYQLRPALVDGRWQIAPRAQTPAEHGVHPVVLLVQVVWGGDRIAGNFRLLLQPMIVLGNPCNVALAPTDYRLVWRQTGIIELRSPPSVPAASAVSGTPALLLGEDPQFLITQAGFRPGEAKVFTLPSAGADPVPYTLGAGLALAEGCSAGGQAYRDLTAVADAVAPDVQVRVSGGPEGFEFFLGNGGRLQVVTACAGNAPDGSGPMPFLGAPVRAGLRMSDNDLNIPGDVSGLRWLASFNLRAAVIGPLPAWGRNPQYDAATPRDGDDNTVLDARHTCWGPANRASDGGQRFVTLFHLPCADLHSLAQLQSAHLQPDNAGPGFTVGQSYADPHTPDSAADFNHRLNDALWDRFFFSTLPAGGDPPPAALPNRRMVYYRRGGIPPAPDAVRNYETAAAHLLIDGPFNVNSTSVEAWQAQLASLNGQQFAWNDPETGATNSVAMGSAFPPSPVVNGDESDGWRGFRALTDAQLHSLAAAIIDRVRAHGPFRSLAEFVNRPLDAAAEEARLSGLLQAALDQVANSPPSLSPSPGLSATAGPSPALPWPAASRGHRSTLAPGWLSQADVLGILGPVLTVRSDTFLLRAYGDAVNPTTGAVESRAWCEAVVQRVPDYVDAGDPPEAVAGLTETNAIFGRRFQIVQFRWLSPEEV